MPGSTGFADQFEGLLRRPGDHGSVADLHDGPIKQSGIGDDGGDDVRFGRLRGETEFLELRFLGSQQGECMNAEFPDQAFERFFVERFDEVIDLVVVYAVLTEQRGQIAAGRSGGFFVDGYLSHIKTEGEVVWKLQPSKSFHNLDTRHCLPDKRQLRTYSDILEAAP